MARPTPSRPAARPAPAGKPSSPARAGLPVPTTAPASTGAVRSAAPVVPPAGREAGRAAKPRDRASPKTLLLLAMLLAPAALIFLPTTMVLAIGMLPTLVALIVDREPEKYAAITVAPLNFCGVLPWLIKLWRHHHTIDGALALLSDPLTLMVMLAAAGGGWLLYYTVPPVIAALATQRNNAEIKRMQEHQAKLVAEWGADVTGATDTPADPDLLPDRAPPPED